MKENKHKEIKQKPGGLLPKEQPSRVLPRTMACQAWLKSKERVLSVTKTNPEGSYASAQEMEEQGVRQGETLLEDGAVFALGKAGNAVRKPLAHEREPNRCPPQEGMREGHSVPPDATNPDPKTAARQEQKRRAARKQSRNFQERQRQTKNTAPGLRGVDRDQKQLRTAANTVRQEKQARQAAQRTQGMLRRARQTAREGVEIARKATTVLRSAIRHLRAALQSLAAVLIAGGWVAAFIVLLICLIALVAGSAYGIFFAAETPDENAISVQEAVELLKLKEKNELENQVLDLERRLANQKEMSEKVSEYYNRFLGWSMEFGLASIERKRIIISQLYKRIELGRGYVINFEVDWNYEQFIDTLMVQQHKGLTAVGVPLPPKIRKGGKKAAKQKQGVA